MTRHVPSPPPPQTQKSGDTCLHKACAGKHVELIRLLLARRAHVGIKNKLFRTPLHVAAEAGDAAAVAALLKHSADPEALDKACGPSSHQPRCRRRPPAIRRLDWTAGCPLSHAGGPTQEHGD